MVSVIVPVFKTEKYLDQCVSSLTAQTLRDLEILLIDDGSPDNCGAMCDAWAARDRRVRVFHTANGGISRARNVGLEAARGEYIGFMDSDDWAEPDMYASLLSLAEESGADIVAGAAVLNGKNGRTKYFDPELPRGSRRLILNREQAEEELLRNTKITNSAWDKLYRRGIFEHVRFTPDVFLEDFDIMPRCLAAAELVIYEPRVLYHYRVRPDSGLHNAGEKNFLFIEQSLHRLEYYRKHFPALSREAAVNHVTNCIACLCNTRGGQTFRPRREELRRQILRDADGETYPRLTDLNRLAVTLLRFGLIPFDAALGFYQKTRGL